MAVSLASPPAWSSDPLLGKSVAAGTVLLAIALGIRLNQSWLSRHLGDADTRYYARNLAALSDYFLAVVGITVIFKDRLGGLTVAIGVAGAGIAFALQEVIGRVAGWIAIPFGGFYRPGDRVHRHPAHHPDGAGGVGPLRPLQRPHRARCQQRRVQAAGVQRLRRLPLPLG
ncbi:MAG: hypothetical protein WBN89_14240 [Prochlorococcaceae cyanobacterium]